jgi:hypothetical protein
MEDDGKSRWPVVVAALVVAGLVGIGWHMKSRSAERAAAEVRVSGDGERGVDWNKVGKDAARMEEKSRQRAERQRAQALEKANQAERAAQKE